VPNDRSETRSVRARVAGPASPAGAPAGGGAAASSGMVRIIVKLRPEQYDDLFRHVREVGSTMSAFCRESALKAMKQEQPVTERGHPP
jgi:hypothetical protein